MRTFSTFIWIWLLAASVVLAQEKKIKEFEEKVKKQIENRAAEAKAKKAPGMAPMPSNMFIIVEFIEVEMEDYGSWLRENPMSSDSTPLRHVVEDWADAGRAKVVETLVVTARSGQRAKVEAVSEFIYPTEYEQSTGAVAQTSGDRKYVDVIPPSPMEYETRNVGTTLEVDPVLSQDGVTVDLNLAPEIVMVGEPIENVTEFNDTQLRTTMPNFLTSKVTTQITVRSGDYGFLGTSRLGETQLKDADDPILLMFVRCDVSGEIE